MKINLIAASIITLAALIILTLTAIIVTTIHAHKMHRDDACRNCEHYKPKEDGSFYCDEGKTLK